MNVANTADYVMYHVDPNSYSLLLVDDSYNGVFVSNIKCNSILILKRSSGK